jgi:hypothetical protein
MFNIIELIFLPAKWILGYLRRGKGGGALTPPGNSNKD